MGDLWGFNLKKWREMKATYFMKQMHWLQVHWSLNALLKRHAKAHKCRLIMTLALSILVADGLICSCINTFLDKYISLTALRQIEDVEKDFWEQHHLVLIWCHHNLDTKVPYFFDNCTAASSHTCHGFITF